MTSFAISRLQPLQYFAIAVGGGHILVLLLYAIFLSPPRQGLATSSESRSFSLEEVDETAQVIMNTFNRTEFKEGNRHWTINANTARYLSQKNVVLLDAPLVTIYKESKEPPTVVSSSSARLTLVEGGVKNALLEGDVVITLSPDLKVTTNLAEYREEEGRLISPERVTIQGAAYRVSGNRMDLSIEKEFISLYEDIDSYFDPSKDKPKFRGISQSTAKN
jgi:LPS export ABC transporter protein LptC